MQKIITTILLGIFLSQNPTITDPVTVSAHAVSCHDGWISLVDENGEEWIFDTIPYDTQSEYQITYSGNFELESLAINGNTILIVGEE